VVLRAAPITDIAGDLVTIVGLTAVIALAAIASFRLLEASARRTGMLGRY